MDLSNILSDAYTSGENLIHQSVNSIIASEKYCAMCEVLITYMQNNRRETEIFAEKFRKTNDRIFRQAMEILDMAIKIPDLHLAKCAESLIVAMRETYPEFYKAFQKKLFGKWEEL